MSLLSGFAFAHPWVLLLLLAIPALSWLKGKFGGTAGVTFSNTSMLAKIASRQKSRAGAFLAALTYLALALFIVALARPQLGRVTTRVQATGVDIMLALDVSRSMLSEDFTIGNRRANRIDTVKLVTQAIHPRAPE
jgi:Ca-activated chloride channel family protein